jgi:hypothetical protein
MTQKLDDTDLVLSQLDPPAKCLSDSDDTKKGQPQKAIEQDTTSARRWSVVLTDETGDADRRSNQDERAQERGVAKHVAARVP